MKTRHRNPVVFLLKFGAVVALVLFVDWWLIGGDLGPVHRAAERGDCVRLERLLVKGRDPNRPATRFSWNLDNRYALNTPLHWAAEGDHPCAVNVLVDHGAHIDAFNGHKQTPLMYAIMHERPNAAAELVRRGADPNLRDRDGFTPLMRALQICLPEVAAELIRHGADLRAVDNYDNSTLVFLNWHRWLFYLDELERLVVLIQAQGYNPNDWVLLRNRLSTMLSFAIYHDMPDAVAALIKRGANVDQTMIAGESALDYARKSNQPNREVIVRLLEEAIERQHSGPSK